ncbi:MAG: LytTR family transcriptional regulator [Saprospiraceae bacterium]|nr:LytTR family transcriptional regulator [Saprospiraceae bacterium]
MREAGNAFHMKERKEGAPLPKTSQHIQLDYRWMTQRRVIVLATASIVCIYTIYTLASPSLLSEQQEQEWRLGFIVRHFFIDIFEIELITTSLLFYAIRIYANWLGWNQLNLNAQRIGRYLLGFLPLFLCIFFLINPITQTIRYWWNYYPDWHADIYYAEYYYSLPLYLRYLIPIFLLGYGALTYNLIRSFNLQQNLLEAQAKGTPEIYLEVYDEKGEKRLPLSSIWWIEVEQRRYFAVGEQGRFRLRQKLNALETQLADKAFFRINRAVLVNWQAVDNCSFWENEKYILRLQNGKEFVMPRQRWVKIKEQLKQDF